ncbi:unnamed protein product [Brassica napus]|uniref:(rape) hypothetical protein n=1 Tax=Brassica napus TaxID=3708 RepID=A0A816MUC5_BRANA|nr:unnamed protein product [Brassica napus]
MVLAGNLIFRVWWENLIFRVWWENLIFRFWWENLIFRFWWKKSIFRFWRENSILRFFWRENSILRFWWEKLILRNNNRRRIAICESPPRAQEKMNGESETGERRDDRRHFLRWNSVSIAKIAKGVAETLFHDEMKFFNFLPNFGNPRIFFLIGLSMSILIKSTNTHRLIGFPILTI